MNKSLALTGLVSALYAADAAAQEIPANVDDGRPSVARTDPERNYDELEWYLSVPIIPGTMVNNVTMGPEIYNLAVGIFDLPKPEGNVLENPDTFLEFADAINSLPHVHGSIAMNETVRFGLLWEWLETHVYGGGYARGDFRFNGLDEYTFGIDPETGAIGADFGAPQNAFIVSAVADLFTGANFVVPVRIDDFILKPSIGFGFRHREALQATLSSDQVVASADNIYYPDETFMRSYGNGWHMDFGLMADFSRWERYVRPVAAISIENAYSEMYYADNSLGFPFNEPVRVNLGIELSPMGWFDVRADFLNVNNNHEYRLEVARRLDWAEFSVYGRLNEMSLLGDIRHSGNIMLGFGNDIAQVRLYASYDNAGDFGIGLQFGLGYRVQEYM